MRTLIFLFLGLMVSFGAEAQNAKILKMDGNKEEIKVKGGHIQTGAASTVTLSLKSPDGKKETTVYVFENSKVRVSQGVLDFLEGTVSVSVVTKGVSQKGSKEGAPFTIKTPSGALSLKDGFLTSMVVKEENKAPQVFILQSSREIVREPASNDGALIVAPLSFSPKNVSMMLDSNPRAIFNPTQRLTKADVLSGDTVGISGTVLENVKNTALESSSTIISNSCTGSTSASNRALSDVGKCP